MEAEIDTIDIVEHYEISTQRCSFDAHALMSTSVKCNFNTAAIQLFKCAWGLKKKQNEYNFHNRQEVNL